MPEHSLFAFSLPTALFVAICVESVLAAVLIYLSRVDHAPRGTTWWAAAFIMGTIGSVLAFAAAVSGETPPLMALQESFRFAMAVLLLAGTLLFTGRHINRAWVVAACCAGALWAGLTTFTVGDFALRTLPLYLFSGAVMILTGWAFWRHGREVPACGHGCVGAAFMIWGLHKFNYPFLRPIEAIAPLGFTLSLVLATIIAVGMVVITQRSHLHYATAAAHVARRYADYDQLTGLPNRRLITRRLAKHIDAANAEGEGVALLVFDLNRFKEVNEALGHAAGDKLLSMIAWRVALSVPPNALLGRISGDNFAIILPQRGLPHAAALLGETILGSLDKPFDVDGQILHMAAGMGIAVYPFDGETAAELMRNAEAAEDEAKRLPGSNFIFFTDHYGENARSRLLLRQDLHRAVEREQFSLFLQPQACARSGRIIGAEALIRWHHPGRGLVSPGEFIPVAEETGLINDIGMWAFRKACTISARLCDEGHALRLFVNLSAVQFRAEDLAGSLEAVLCETGADPAMMGIEITESTLLHSPEETATTMARLRAMGLEVAIDDFGTGYSSLSQLRRLPLDKLKIDMSFLRAIPGDTSDEAVVRGIIRLGQSIGLQLVAEGVERDDQAAFLRREGCDQFQGYLLGRPLPCEQFVAMLDEKETPLPFPFTARTTEARAG